MNIITNTNTKFDAPVGVRAGVSWFVHGFARLVSEVDPVNISEPPM